MVKSGLIVCKKGWEQVGMRPYWLSYIPSCQG